MKTTAGALISHATLTFNKTKFKVIQTVEFSRHYDHSKFERNQLISARQQVDDNICLFFGEGCVFWWVEGGDAEGGGGVAKSH